MHDPSPMTNSEAAIKKTIRQARHISYDKRIPAIPLLID